MINSIAKIMGICVYCNYCDEEGQGAIEMDDFEKIKEEMKKQRIIPRIHYELIALRVLKVVAALLIGAAVVWVMVK